jgi:hypothetical protein
MRPEKFLDIGFFQTNNEGIFAIVESPETDFYSQKIIPTIPIVCLNTGFGCKWIDFESRNINEVYFNIQDIEAHRESGERMCFGDLSPGAIFIFCDRERENPQIGVKLFGSPTEKNQDKMVGYSTGYFLALCLNDRQFKFGISIFFDHVRDMMWWPVHKINLPITEFVNPK